MVDVPFEDNGQPVLDYELNLTHALSGRAPLLGLGRHERGGPRRAGGVEQVNSYMYARHERNVSLEPGALYTVHVRARNGIGWSDASVGVNCTASELRGEDFPWMAALVPTILMVLCLLGCVIWCKTSNANKIFAPKLRMKVVDDEVLKDFVDDSVTAMEDADPELVLNPVLVARMQLEKESAMRGKRARARRPGAQQDGRARAAQPASVGGGRQEGGQADDGAGGRVPRRDGGPRRGAARQADGGRSKEADGRHGAHQQKGSREGRRSHRATRGALDGLPKL